MRQELPAFEIDRNQNDVPTGHTAYLLRWPGIIVEGDSVVEVRLWNGKPFLIWAGASSQRSSRFPDEVSRVFVRNGARIDPRVFEATVPAPAGDMGDTSHAFRTNVGEPSAVQSELTFIEIELRKKRLELEDINREIIECAKADAQRQPHERMANMLQILQRQVVSDIETYNRRRVELRRALGLSDG